MEKSYYDEKYEYKQAEKESAYLYNQYDAMRQIESANAEKLAKFKERIKSFELVITLKEAKELAKRILPVAKEINRFSIGNAKCTIISKDDNFRICLDTPNEFISYDFV